MQWLNYIVRYLTNEFENTASFKLFMLSSLQDAEDIFLTIKRFKISLFFKFLYS